MPVAVMQVGEVGMRVAERRVLVPVHVRFRAPVTPGARVRMLVVRVMDVAMAVRLRFVGVRMSVLFTQHQPRRGRHQQ